MIPAFCKRRGAVAALSIGAALGATVSANAAEAILFDGNNCSGQYRMTDRKITDFNEIGFDNQVNSLMVITGAFRFYRDSNYGENNGPSFELGPSGFQETCWSLNDASGGNFPNDRMSSVQFLQDSPEPQPDGVAILYDNTNLGGQYRILTRTVGDFNQIGFDNDAESIRVVSGTWTFFRDSNFGAPADRPSITLGPGDYANVAQVPGYPNNYFPGDLMSSASVVGEVAPPPPPPPLACDAGQIAGDTQCHFCWDHFGNEPNSSFPNAAGTACDCAPGYEWVGFTAAGIDGINVRDCRPVQAPPPPPPTCTAPYSTLNQATNQCVFNCHQSTQPNNQTGQCDCLPGTQQAGFLNDGRQYCLGIPSQDQQPAQDTRYTVPAGQIIPAAQAAGFTMTTQIDEGGAVCTINGNTVIFQMTNAPDNKPRICIATLFGGRQLAPGWRFEDYNMSVAYGQAVPTGLTAQLPFSIQLNIPPFQDKVIVQINSIDLIGPAGQTWQQALQ